MGNTNKPSSPNELAEQVNRSNARIKNDFNNSLDTTKRVINKTNKTIDVGFNKEVAKPFNKAFSKANMERVDDELVKGLKDSGRVLGKIGEYTDKVLDNPITQLASSIPVVGQVIGGLRLANTGIKAGGALTGGIGNIADRKAYQGKNDKQIVGNLLERTVNTGENVIGSGIKFA